MLPQRLNNPLAPPAFNGLSAITPEYRDEDFAKFFQITLTANQVVNNVGVQLDKDADFIWEAVLAQNTSGFAYSIRFSDSSGYYLSDTQVGNFVLQANANGVGVPFVLPVPLFMAAGSAIICDFIEQSGNVNTIQFLFRGQKRFYH